MKNSNYILATALMAIFSSGALAEETTLEEVQVKTSQDKPSLNLTKRNTTGSRLGLTAQETPASVESLDTETIKKRGDFSIRDAITRTTGLTDVSTPGRGNAFSSRGFIDNSSVGQAEDGIRLMTIGGTLTYPSDIWGYESVEVLRGPASVLYGDATAGGIINSIRKQPKREASAEALVGIGTRGEYRIGIGGTGAVGEIGAFRLDASTTGGNGFIDRGEHDSKKIMTALQLTPTDHLKIGFTLDHSDESPTANFGSPLRNGKLVSAFRKTNLNVEDTVMDFRDTRFKAKVEWDISSTLSLRNVSYWFKTDRDWVTAERYRLLNPASNIVTRDNFYDITHDARQSGNRLELVSSAEVFGHSNRWNMGWEISRTDLDYYISGTSPTDTLPVNASFTGFFPSSLNATHSYSSKANQNAFFAENAWDATDKLKLLIGFRKEFIDISVNPTNAANFSRDYAALTWRLGAVFQVTDNASVYAQTSRGTDPVRHLISMNLANRLFSLTKVRQTEIGWKYLLPEAKGEMTLAAFHIVKDDIITRNQDNPLNPAQGGSQSSRGIEFSTTLLPTDYWRLDFNATLLNARFDELKEGNTAISRAGNTPENVPEKVANAWVYYTQPAWEAGLGARYVGKRYVNNANINSLDAYTVFDASAAWHVNPRMTLRANLRNITDKLYGIRATYTDQAIVGTPRQLELTAEFRY